MDFLNRAYFEQLELRFITRNKTLPQPTKRLIDLFVTIVSNLTWNSCCSFRLNIYKEDWKWPTVSKKVVASVPVYPGCFFHIFTWSYIHSLGSLPVLIKNSTHDSLNVLKYLNPVLSQMIKIWIFLIIFFTWDLFQGSIFLRQIVFINQNSICVKSFAKNYLFLIKFKNLITTFV